MLRLTEEQYDVLSSIDDNAGVFVYGAAGTGKSLLAVEKIKTTMCKKRQVAYICFNNNMASYVKVVEGSYIGIYYRLLHYGERSQKKEALEQIYIARDDRLQNSGIRLNKDQFLCIAE